MTRRSHCLPLLSNKESAHVDLACRLLVHAHRGRMRNPRSVFGQTAPTQIDSNSTTGPTPYGSFGGVHENINLATGDLTLQIPLLTLPGRNGFDLSVGLTYDSKVQILNYMADPITPDIWDYWWAPEERQPAVEGWSGGWRLSVPVLQAINYDIGPGAGYSDQNCMEYFIVTMPDGRKAQFTNRAACSGINSSQQIVAEPANNIPVSESQEGSFLRLDTTNPADVVLYEKNGTRHDFLTGWQYASHQPSPQFFAASTITDSNGNVISINSTPATSTALEINSITDSLKRIVTFTYNSSKEFATISYKDSSGLSRTISFGYTTVPLTYTFANPPNSGTCSGTGCEEPRLTSISLPNGLGYNF